MIKTFKNLQEKISQQTENLCTEYLKRTGAEIKDCVLCHQLGKDGVYKIWIETVKPKIHKGVLG